MPDTSDLATAVKMCTWECPDLDSLTDAETLALGDWLKMHGLDPFDVQEAVVLTDELHVTQILKDAAGRPFVDYAANRIVTWPKVVPLQAVPPVAGKRHSHAV